MILAGESPTIDREAAVGHADERQAQLDGAERGGRARLVLPSSEPGLREVWYLLRGQRWAQLTVTPHENAGERADRLRPRERARCTALLPQEGRVIFPFAARQVVEVGRAPQLGLLGFPGRDDRAVVAEAMVCLIRADAFLEKFGGDSLGEMRRNGRGYLEAAGRQPPLEQDGVDQPGQGATYQHKDEHERAGHACVRLRPATP